jgi:L,D-peptidoglycan transpeptidase YkuD (ErfK/YbiS/YcfS/YnhG family)
MPFRRLLFVSALLALVARLGAEEGRFAGSGQIVVVAAADWESPTATLTRFERTARGWAAIDSWPVTLGHRGLGWGLGLHPAGLAGPEKREGDRRAPAGIFVLESAFGTKAVESRAFPYRRTDEADLWIDDPESSHYNQWVRTGDPASKRDWNSAEVLRRDDGLYDLAIVVGHNRSPVVKGAGSAIFIHSWVAPGRSTIGCTAMEKRRVRELFDWLDASKRPLLVQAPREAAPMLGLPDAVLAAFDAPAATRR